MILLNCLWLTPIPSASSMTWYSSALKAAVVVTLLMQKVSQISLLALAMSLN